MRRPVPRTPPSGLPIGRSVVVVVVPDPHHAALRELRRSLHQIGVQLAAAQGKDGGADQDQEDDRFEVEAEAGPGHLALRTPVFTREFSEDLEVGLQGRVPGKQAVRGGCPRIIGRASSGCDVAPVGSLRPRSSAD